MKRSQLGIQFISILIFISYLQPTPTISQSASQSRDRSSRTPSNINSFRSAPHGSKWTRTTRRTTTTTTTTTPPPIEDMYYDTEDELQDTLDLLSEGETQIILDPRYKDVILMMGNTGAGKTTIGQFLTGNNSDLESYEGLDGHFLIRDKLQKISENSTLVSKSIFPDLLIHSDRQVAFYDYPGFSDTRSPSVEIANAFFMKKVADFARSVKILFVVNYSSLKIGQNRLDFKNMMDHALNFLKQPAKFSRGIALIATKVEYPWTDTKLVGGIAKFLESVIEDLPTFFANSDSDLARAESLIEALLTKDRQGRYNRIGIFRQPDQIGPLNTISTTQASKPMLEKIVYENLQYVPKTADDFGVTISPRAILLVKNLAEKYNDNIDTLVLNLGLKIEQHFSNLAATAPLDNNQNENEDDLELLGLFKRLASDWQDLDKMIGQLSKMAERKEFLKTVVDTLRDLEVSGIEPILLNLLRADETLDFFLRTGEAAFPARTAKWLQPIRKANNFLADKWLELGSKINQEITKAVDTLAVNMRNSFDEKIRAHTDDSHQINRELKRGHQLLAGVIEEVEGARDVQTIFDSLANFIVESNLSISNNSGGGAQNGANFFSQFSRQGIEINLDDEIVNKKSAPFSPSEWIKPLKNLLQNFDTQRYTVAQKMNTAVDTILKKVGAELTRIYRSNNNAAAPNSEDPDENQKNLNQQYENLKEEFNQFYALTNGLKNSKFLTNVLNQLLHGLQHLSVQDQISPDVWSDLTKMMAVPSNDDALWKENDKIDLSAPINGRSSPYRLQDWLSPLESALVILQTRIAELARKLGETASEQRMGQMMAEKEAMDQKLGVLMETQEKLAQKQEEERRAWREREQQIMDREREERLRRDEETRQWRKEEQEREDQRRAEADARMDRLQQANLQLLSQQNKQENRKDWFSMAAGAASAIVGGLFG